MGLFWYLRRDQLHKHEEFDRLVEKAVELRESGDVGQAIILFLLQEKEAKKMNDVHRELSTLGQRLVCYLHLLEEGVYSCVPLLHDNARDGIRRSLKLKGHPEIRTLRFRYAQALYFMHRYEAAYKQLNIALRGLSRNDAQYFQFLPLRALVSHQIAKERYASADQDISDSLTALDDWKKDRKDDSKAEYLALIYHTGILLKLAEIHFVNKSAVNNLDDAERIEEEADLAASGLTIMVNRLANEFNSPIRKRQWERLKKKYRPKKDTKRTR